MKKLLPSFYILLLILLIPFALFAQWCIPTTIIPYASTMPGITNVTVGNINRSSGDIENYPSNSYVNTGLTFNAIAGSTYSVSITHTIDGSICPDMNLRVWIDYNHDYQLNDPGETVISVDHHLPGTYTGSFTIPATVTTGITRMRITAKMSNLGGHSLPDPCDIPPDPLGYHGEIEDYDISITTASGTDEHLQRIFTIYPNPASEILNMEYINQNTSTEINIYDLSGKSIYHFTDLSNTDVISLDLRKTEIKQGMYYVALVSGSNHIVKKLVVLN